MNRRDNNAEQALEDLPLWGLWLTTQRWSNTISIAFLILSMSCSVLAPAQATTISSESNSKDETETTQSSGAEANQLAASIPSHNHDSTVLDAQDHASEQNSVDATLNTPEQITINTKVTDVSGAGSTATTAPALVNPELAYVINSTVNSVVQPQSGAPTVLHPDESPKVNLSEIPYEELLRYKPANSAIHSHLAANQTVSYAAIQPDSAAPPSDPIASLPNPASEAIAPTNTDITDHAETATGECAAACLDRPELLTQVTPTDSTPATETAASESEVLGVPYIRLQGVYLLQGDESSARARVTGFYPVSPSLAFGAEVDLTTGDSFSDSRYEGLNLNELYVTASLPDLPNLRFVGGLMDLTSYFDRNSFAKDGTLHFFNPVFQTNPALSATGIASRPGLLANWSITDNLDVRAATFSSSRSLDEFELDAFAGEVAVRFGNAIVRGTYVSARDAGSNDGFQEIFQFDRGNGDFGLESDDREDAFGLNAEVFIPSLNLGLFGRYGHYQNRDLDEGGNTFSVGFNFLDLFLPDDRLGLAYGRLLSNDDLRRDRDEVPDVVELFYDIRVARHLRAGVTLQALDQFSDTIAGFRIRTEFDAREIGRLFR